MLIRKAVLGDVDAINAIYLAIHEAEAKGLTTTGWRRGIYPVRQTAEEAIAKGEMYVALENDYIVGAARINKEQPEEYAGGAWQEKVSPSKVMVLHTLVVNPKVKGRGIGGALVKFYEETALKDGSTYLRMDTNVKNLRARALYKSLGFREAGIVESPFHGIKNMQLVCLEKPLIHK